MKKLIFLFIFLLFVFYGCSTKEKVDKSQVSTVEKLGSPDGRFIFYRYYVESGMAFGSGSVRMNILKSSEAFDYSTDEYFTLENAAPVILGRKDLKIEAV